MPIEKILFPTKFRELAFDALETLFKLKEAGLKEIVLLHVILREDVGFVPFGGYLKEEEKRFKNHKKLYYDNIEILLREICRLKTLMSLSRRKKVFNIIAIPVIIMFVYSIASLFIFVKFMDAFNQLKNFL